MLVQEIMTKRIQSIKPDKTVLEACEKFKTNNVGSLVVKDNELIVGIITERDIILKIVLKNKKPKNTLVREILTPNLKTIHALSTVEEAAEIMKTNNIKKLPVTYNNNLVGIITETDIASALKIISNDKKKEK